MPLKRLTSSLLAVVLGIAGTVPALADPIDPTGIWRSATGESKYELSMCGDGTQLCAKLVWLSEGERTPKNLPFLGTYLLENARPTRENQWAGEVHLYDQTAGGTVTLIDENTIDLTGCAFIVFCKTFYLNRES